MLQNKNIDFIIRGEGEIILKNVLDCLSNDKEFSTINGICFKEKDSNNIIVNPFQERMKTFDLLLSSINDVKDFVNIVSKYDFDVDLTSGRYVVDAKSIMGIFSLDLSKPIKVEVHSDDCDKFMEELDKFIIK